MEAGAILLVGCVSGFFCAALLGKGIYEGIHFAFLASRANEERQDALERGGARKTLYLIVRHYARNGVPSLVSSVRFLGRVRWLERTFSNAASFLRRRGWASGSESAGTLLAVSFLFVAAVVFFTVRSFAAALLIPSCAFLAVAVYLSRERDREQSLLRDQVPDALRCMEACLHAGLSLPQAFAEVAEEMEAPAKDLFSRVSRDPRLGVFR